MRMCPSVTRRRMPGFTLVELVSVLVLVGILSVYVVSKAMSSAGQSTAGYQAVRLASDLRHTQMLALAWGVALTFTSTPSSYSVSCATSTTAPCPPSTSPPTPVTDPGHSGAFSVTLDNSVTLNATSVTFDILGQPATAPTFTFTSDSKTMAAVTVAANTGFVTGP